MPFVSLSLRNAQSANGSKRSYLPCVRSQSRTRTNTHKYTRTYPTHIHTHTCTHIHIRTHTHTRTHRHAPHTHTNTHSHHTGTHKHTPDTHTRTHSQTHIHAHTHRLARMHTHAHGERVFILSSGRPELWLCFACCERESQSFFNKAVRSLCPAPGLTGDNGARDARPQNSAQIPRGLHRPRPAVSDSASAGLQWLSVPFSPQPVSAP